MEEIDWANSDEREMLAALMGEFKRLNKKVDLLTHANEKIIEMQHEMLQDLTSKKPKKKDVKLEPDTIALLTLPAALRKTIMALYKMDQATADDLANETKRLRAVESAVANELVRMGYIKKKRDGRKVYFYIE